MKLKKIYAIILSLAMGISLVACGSSEEEEVTTETEVEEVEEVDYSDDEEVEQPTPVTIEINETIIDEELGFTLNIKQAILNLPFDEEYQDLWYNGYRTGLCVEVELTNNSEYSTYLYDHDLSLYVNDSDSPESSNTGMMFQSFIDENGTTPIDSSGAESGETITGWMFFYFETGDGIDKLTMRYLREETEIIYIGSDEKGLLPELTIDVEIPVE